MNLKNKAIHSSVKVFELLPPLVDTDMVADRQDKKISTQQLVKGLILGMKKDVETIKVGIQRLFPFLIGLRLRRPII
ncbi:hypothetical protein KUH03_40340 [Sphingobacterium sp. E70]|uniref:hypothetical protein n=1 Tax=Sphingobacterium sp. E70 TaxID=2853439 RepID=UPI00211C6D69|nr:hypothetical protein [Sphingobacterium sp. E70]ULT25046.1 hypothetical protein KUH03_40340 [Sphingobacterium sp. E70]